MNIPARALEAQFVYFYDLKVRIVAAPSIDPRNQPFALRDVAASELSLFYFSDSFIGRWVRAHFHIVRAHCPELKQHLSNELGNQHIEFSFPQLPFETTDPIESFSAVECTLFENGILAVTIRLKNVTAVLDAAYLEAIARPEFLLNPRDRPRPGWLIEKVDAFLMVLEPRLAAFLNVLNLQVVHMDGGKVRRLAVMSRFTPISGALAISEAFSSATEDIRDQKLKPGASVDPQSEEATGQWRHDDAGAPVLHYLQRSRPYVGTVVDLTVGREEAREIPHEVLEIPATDQWRQPLSGDHVLTLPVYRFAIAAARTTPKFLQSFTNLEQYWTEHPRRNVYHPGPSIVFIARRGWTCIKLEHRDALAFHLGIVETVLFALQATFASFRATRRFVEQLKKRGDRFGIALNQGIVDQWLVTPKRFRTVMRDLRLIVTAGPKPPPLERKIGEFTSFLARARLNAPVDDMSVLLRSHLMTHTGISAVRRIRDLLEYDAQMENARHTLAGYAASLEGANQYWTSRSRRMATTIAILRTITIAMGVLTLWFKWRNP